jgi:selenide,water dikinase
VLRPLKNAFQTEDYPDLIIGLNKADDAAVWRLDDQRALILTTDFFTPVVDDPYDYGAIAAANSLSDIYAMGGKPFLALNVAALPADLPPDFTSEIIRGGAEKARQAGVVIAGGHTVQDKEPKYGLVVAGFVHPEKMLTKSGAQVGDRLVLTKPLGFGVTTTALKRENAEVKDVAEVVNWMAQLNECASQLAVQFELSAATDVTGFSLLGHGWEMAHASGVGFRIHYDSLPFVSCARHYAEAWTFPGGASANKAHFGEHVRFDSRIDEASQMLLFDPQTSGGLLLCVPGDRIDDFLENAEAINQPAWQIGDVVEGEKIEIA